MLARFEQALTQTGHSKPVDLPDSLDGGGSGAGSCRADGSGSWIRQGDATRPPMNIAFRVPSWAAVEAFHEAAIAAGGRDNGAPGSRPHGHASYHGDYVLDPDGYFIEAISHDAQ